LRAGRQIQQIKQYAGGLSEAGETPADPARVDIKGLESQQRDTPPYIAACVAAAVTARLLHGPDAAVDAAAAAVRRVLRHELPLDQLAFTRGARDPPSAPKF
jgi:DNA polymerase elongation subunit (family B)